jgi:exosortase
LSHIAYIILLISLLLALYGAALIDLFQKWYSSYNSEYAQGLVIVPFAILVAWLRRASVAAISAHGELRGLILVGIGCALHLFGRLAVGMYASQLSFVLVLAGIIWVCWGAGRLRALALPLILLAVAIPLPALVYSRLSMPLRMLASTIACWVADLIGVSVYREGAIIHLAGMSLGVWEACSGLQSLSALMVGAVPLGFALCRFPLTRLLVCLSAIPIAVMANIVRVTGTAILSDWHPAYAMGFYHAFSGWLLFVVGSIGLCGAAFGFRRLLES